MSLLAQSRHSNRADQCPLSGVKRTCTGSPAEDFDFGSDARVIGGNHGIAVRHHRSTLFGRDLVNSFILDVGLTLAAASFASLDCLGAIASLASVNASNGLDALDTLASLNALSAFVGVNALDALASLDSLHTFAGLDALHTPAIRDALSARPSLNPLNGLASLDALHTSCAYITKLLLKVCISEADIAVMSGVELPALELTATGDIDSVKSAVKSGVRLDCCVAWVSPIVMVPQRRANKERRAEPERRSDRPPRRIPEEWYICRWPISGTVDDHRIIDRHIDVIRFDRLDCDVLGRPCIARDWRCGDPADLLLLARLQSAGGLRLFAECLNRVLYVIGLGQKGLAELVGPVQLLVHHREHLWDRR